MADVQKNLLNNFTRFELNTHFINLISEEWAIFAITLCLSDYLEECIFSKAKCYVAKLCVLTMCSIKKDNF